MEDLRPAITATLAHRAGAGADAAQVTDAIVSTWRDIDTALRPILGQRGVASLYNRSLHLAAAAYPWLAIPQGGIPTVMDLAPLQSGFAQRSSADAKAAGEALLQCFHELLVSLIGPSLSERLLRSVWENPSSGAPAQDTSP